jgi:predicted GNAT family acetyltransferase
VAPARAGQDNFAVCNSRKKSRRANAKLPAQTLPERTGGLDTMNNPVSNNPAHHRFELAVDGHIAATYYELADGVITFVHTEVPPELGGKGVGSQLVKGALDQVRADGLKVVGQCPFVKAWIDKHPDYADLLKA